MNNIPNLPFQEKSSNLSSFEMIDNNPQTKRNESILSLKKKKRELKLSLDSTNSLSKHPLSSFIPSFSCEKLPKHFDHINNYNKEHLDLSKEKFFDVYEKNDDFLMEHHNKQNNYPFHSFEKDHFHSKINRSFNQESPINALENNKISKESYISELARSKNLKYSRTNDDSSKGLYFFPHLDGVIEGNHQADNHFSSISFSTIEDYLKKH